MNSSPEFSESTIEKLQQCYAYLKTKYGKVAVMGFCFGGTYSFSLAANQPSLDAAVVFYGHPPQENDISKIRCPILAFYSENDSPLMESLPALQEMMEKNNVTFKFKVYKGCGHAFFNDQNPKMYNAEAAKSAWMEVVDFLKKNL